MADTSLQVVESQSSFSKLPQSFAPQTFQEALVFAQQLAKSSLVPQDYRNKPENILVAIQHGAEIGLPPMQALNSIAVINGHPGIYGDAALAIVKGHRDFEWIRESFDDAAWTATCVIKRRNEPEVTQTFSKADAQRAGLWDEREKISRQSGGEMRNPAPWYCYPKRMLKFRARGFALRDSFPDALRGIVTAEEVADYPNAIEGQPITQSSPVPSTPSAPAAEKTIQTIDATEFYNLYRDHGHTVDEAKKWLSDTLQIGAPHNDKDSRAMPESRFEEAKKWASTKTPAREEADKLLEILGWTPEEGKKFRKDQKWNWPAIVEALKSEIGKRDAAE